MRIPALAVALDIDADRCPIPAARLKLRALHRFTSTATAVEDITALQEGKISKSLKKFLTAEVVDKGKGKETLAVIDSKLGAHASA